MTVTLLGPQRLTPSLGATVRSLGGEGRVATVTAGWREREGEDAELDAVLDGRSRNLSLYRRWRALLAEDPEYAAAERALRDELEDLQALYELRLESALAAVAAVQRSTATPRLQEAALADAIAEVRRLDEWHLRCVSDTRAAFDRDLGLAERAAVRRHRAEVAELLDGASTLAIAGGHVGVLLACLRLFAVPMPAERSLVAWSAGAMALAERVVLFHDFIQQGGRSPEVFDTGLGVVRGIIPLPHARRRLQLKDTARTAVLARRFAPACCLVLDDGVRVDVGADGGCPAGARVLTSAGEIATVDAGR